MTSPKSDGIHFSEALLNPELALPDGIIGPDGKPAPKRFNVYRNNVVVSLCEALGKTYPSIKALLGDDYFNALARAFVTENPPQSAVLIWYGAEFADFIAAFPPLEAYPYLSDVARAEWAWLQAYHAADVAPMDPADLSALPPEEVGDARFQRHPAAWVISTAWPVWDLLRVNRFEEEAEIDLSAGQPILITRPELDVEVICLRPGADLFLQGLFKGQTLGEAAMVAQENCPEFSLSDSLSDCLSNGAFQGLATARTDQTRTLTEPGRG